MRNYPKHYRPKSGEYVPHTSSMQWQCCDCGLVHNVSFRLLDEKTGRVRYNFHGFMIAVKMTRNEKETKKNRTIKDVIKFLQARE